MSDMVLWLAALSRCLIFGSLEYIPAAMQRDRSLEFLDLQHEQQVMFLPMLQDILYMKVIPLQFMLLLRHFLYIFHFSS